VLGGSFAKLQNPLFAAKFEAEEFELARDLFGTL
jgi:hypothetical protein